MPHETPARDAIERWGGIDLICSSIADGRTFTGIAKEIGVSFGALMDYVGSNSEFSARVREARTLAARFWDEKAVEVIENAGEDFDLKKAKELAHHYRWRASKIAPKEYGERLEVDGKGAMPLVIVKDFTGSKRDEPADD